MIDYQIDIVFIIQRKAISMHSICTLMAFVDINFVSYLKAVEFTEYPSHDYHKSH